MSIAEDVLTEYLKAQKELVAFEPVNDGSVLVSLPLHFAGITPVELAVTRISDDQFLLSDLGQTIGELREAGYAVGEVVRQRMTGIAKLWHVELSGNQLVRTCSKQELGVALQQFGEVAKTVGDAYLTHTRRDKRREEQIKSSVRRTLKRYQYQERQSIPGNIEQEHKVDFYVHPNGANGLALTVLTNPTHIVAEAWGFKTQDIKTANERLVVAVIYDAERAQEVSRTIIDRMADISLSSAELRRLGMQLKAKQVGRG